MLQWEREKNKKKSNFSNDEIRTTTLEYEKYWKVIKNKLNNTTTIKKRKQEITSSVNYVVSEQLNPEGLKSKWESPKC